MPRQAAAILLLVFVAGVEAQALSAKFDATRDAAADVATAVAQAKHQDKRVLVYVGGEWCVWCHIMDRFFEADAEARALRDANYVLVKVNWSKENKNEALLSRWPAVAGYPHLFVLDDRGALLQSQDTGVLEQGRGYDRARFMAFLRRYAPPR